MNLAQRYKLVRRTASCLATLMLLESASQPILARNFSKAINVSNQPMLIEGSSSIRTNSSSVRTTSASINPYL